MMDELNQEHSRGYSGTRGLAELVMLSGTEPYLTRTRARFEMLLQSRDDPDLDATMREYGIEFYDLACRVIAHWYNDSAVPEAHVHERAVVVLTFISGVMTSFVQGYPVVTDAAQLDELIRQILHSRPPEPH
ncbi:hypothetical protein ACAG26_15040 [Mycobacterium sp. pUA109]|uniref:hypothetical protein n=1 Tax=Mycobacterium sp. pUA109 TaxID=3238982 RepID=UPI00351AC9D3